MLEIFSVRKKKKGSRGYFENKRKAVEVALKKK